MRGSSSSLARPRVGACRRRPHPVAIRLSPELTLGESLCCDDLDGRCLCAKLWVWWHPWATAKRHSAAAWDGASRRAAHAWPRLGVQYERDVRECVRRAVVSGRTAAARFGLTIRDSSSCHLNGRRNPADARPTLRDEAVRLHRCKMRAAATTWRRRARAFRALRVSGAHQAGCDPFARKRPEKLTKAHNYRLNIPALGLRRVVSSGFLSPPLPLAADDKTHQQQPLKCPEGYYVSSCWNSKQRIQRRG